MLAVVVHGTPARAEAPLALHPDNPHYFLWRGKPTVLVTSGEHYGALLNLNLDYSFTADAPDGTFGDYKSPGGGSPALRKQLGILKRFFEGMDFVKMRPDATVVRKASDGLTARALAEPGKTYAVYLHVPLPNKPKDIAAHLRTNCRADLSLELPAGDYRVEWLNTLTGESAGDALQHTGGACGLKSPAFDNDIALRLTRMPAR